VSTPVRPRPNGTATGAGAARPYAGAWPVLLTPFTESGDVDWPAYEALLRWFLERGVGGLFAVCLSSEMYDLTPEERHRLARVAVDLVGGRVPVVATGSFGEDASAHAESVRRTAATGVDAVILTVPPFARSEAELERYFDAILEGTDAPLGIYECPVPERRSLPATLVERLARSGRFVAYKETSCDLPTLEAKCAAAAGTPMAVLQANTPYLRAALRLGCTGSMCISANVGPDLARDALTLPGPEGVEAHRRLCVVDALMRLNHPVAGKFLLAERGLPLGLTTRKRTPPLSEEVKVLLRESWRLVQPQGAGAGTAPAPSAVLGP
jgi:4-hydroxy-tetrahydrodipicolinate synthase